MRIHGLACFETSNGLQASGSGRLKFADKHTGLFEFRTPKLGGSEYLSTNVPTFFIRKFYYRGILAHLVGVVKKTRDKFGRAGFWGIGAMVDDDQPLESDLVNSIFELSDRAYTSSAQERQEIYSELLAENGDFPPGDLAEYEEREVLLFSIEEGTLSDKILSRSKHLMEIEPSYYSTVIVQLGKAASHTHVELSEEQFKHVSDQLASEAEQIQSHVDLENMDPHIRRFMERTDKLGVPRPDWVDADFESYLIGLIRYVNSSVAQKKR